MRWWMGLAWLTALRKGRVRIWPKEVQRIWILQEVGFYPFRGPRLPLPQEP